MASHHYSSSVERQKFCGTKSCLYHTRHRSRAFMSNTRCTRTQYVFKVFAHTGFLSISQVHVFQALPFLGSANEAFISCREFVCHQLPGLQTSMPKILDNICEARLDDDIDNDNVRVVRGDGVETSSGRHDLEVQIEHDSPPSDQNLPSWGPTSLPPDVTSDTSETDTKSEVASSVAASIQSHPGLRRIKSTLSVLAAETSLTKMSEGIYTSGHHSKSSYSVAHPSSPRIHKARSHTSMTSFVEQWTLSSKSKHKWQDSGRPPLLVT